MSNEENSNTSEEITEPVQDETKAPEQKKSPMQAVMDNCAMIMKIKEENPKLLYGVGGGVILLILVMMLSGGGGGTSDSVKATTANLQVGSQYVLRSANSYESNSTVRLVSTPGNMAAYDDTEKADREGCKHLSQGTKIIIKDFYAAYGNAKAFAKVSPVLGECKGSLGWTSTNNIQTK